MINFKRLSRCDIDVLVDTHPYILAEVETFVPYSCFLVMVHHPSDDRHVSHTEQVKELVEVTHQPFYNWEFVSTYKS